ncbi:MAG: Gfo/Idh/MocA family oxidoreductase [Bacteroidales bacterium]|nr:Gfo/Idh/MocA family oxidoreductase [Lachnoclostridium sp.]MCM1384584.1 Gfo/Idh/MocA family oxidoreductase [Lachnoclostridium sp.]MCM1465134.1 Gfo/Idh/MocA family oxidoreductase [Bacteroidales bacterium]
MKKIRIGILGASDIAYRRFLPALKKTETFEFAGVAVADCKEWGGGYEESSYAPLLSAKKEKAEKFLENFGGKLYVGYENLLCSEEIDAVYVPLPPSLHYFWCHKALTLGKHVLSEKPCTVKEEDTAELVRLAEEKRLALNENYAFSMHKQIGKIKELISEGAIGEVRLVRSAFGFPYRNASDFRYIKELGGGALLDCGGYVLKAAQLFLGEDIRVLTAALHSTPGHNVDIYGSVVVADKDRREAQLAFGMDNSYRCELEVWGSKACILAPRIFTPPADFEAQIIIKGQQEEVVKVEPDDQFAHGIEFFGACIDNEEIRKAAGKDLLRQARLLEEVREKDIVGNY